ncbi:hypothetical protein MRX96_038702 [Rhipicephalus microplus]
MATSTGGAIVIERADEEASQDHEARAPLQSDARVVLNSGRRHAHRCAAGDRRESRERRPEAGTAAAGKTTGTERRMLIPPLRLAQGCAGEKASRPLDPGMRLDAPQRCCCAEREHARNRRSTCGGGLVHAFETPWGAK